MPDDIPNIELSEPVKTDYSKPFKDMADKEHRKYSEIELSLEACTYIPLIEKWAKEKEKISVWEVIWFILKNSPSILFIIYNLIKLFTNFNKGDKMTNDKKTTIMGIIKMLIITTLTIIGSDKIGNIDNTSGILIAFIGSIWALVDLIQGIFINKADKSK